MGIFSFSVGEMMVIAGAVLTAAAILLSAVYGAAWIFEKQRVPLAADISFPRLAAFLAENLSATSIYLP